MSDLKERIFNIVKIVTNKEIHINEVDVELSTLCINSMDFVRIIVAIEENVGIVFPDEYLLMSKMNTLSKIISVVSELLLSNPMVSE